MPIYRRYRKRRAAPKPYKKVYKRKGYKKVARKMAKYTNINKDLFYFKKKRIGIQIDCTAAPSGALQFQLSDIVNPSEITSMFDQYMIYGVKVGFRLIYNPDVTGNVATSIYPNLYLRKDFDDNTPESSTQIIQSNKSRRYVLQPNRLRSIFIRPSFLTTAIAANGTQVNRPVWKQWLDCSNDSIPHIGLKYAMDTMGAALPANTRHLQIEFTYYIAAKNTR